MIIDYNTDKIDVSGVITHSTAEDCYLSIYQRSVTLSFCCNHESVIQSVADRPVRTSVRGFVSVPTALPAAPVCRPARSSRASARPADAAVCCACLSAQQLSVGRQISLFLPPPPPQGVNREIQQAAVQPTTVPPSARRCRVHQLVTLV